MTPVHTRHPKNIAELKRVCKEELSKIPSDRFASLINNYRKRLVEVIAAKGGSTSERLHGVFNKDTKTYHCLCVISLSRLSIIET